MIHRAKYLILVGIAYYSSCYSMEKRKVSELFPALIEAIDEADVIDEGLEVVTVNYEVKQEKSIEVKQTIPCPCFACRYLAVLKESEKTKRDVIEHAYSRKIVVSMGCEQLPDSPVNAMRATLDWKRSLEKDNEKKYEVDKKRHRFTGSDLDQ